MITKPEVVAAFANAARHLPHPPADPEVAFQEWLALATPKNVPREVLGRVIEAFDGLIRVWSADGVSAVLCDGRLRCFLPTRLCLPGRDIEMSVALRRLDAWLADPAGRVPGAEPFERLRGQPAAPTSCRHA